MKRQSLIRLIAVGSTLLPIATVAAADPVQIVETVCVACHGTDGNSVAPTFPKLASQHVIYLEKQLNDLLSGKRQSATMEPFLSSFTKADISGLAAYYAGQKITPAEVQDKVLAEAGRKLYEDGNTDSGVPACSGCHQPKGEGNDRYPRLAGQHQEYTINEMNAFKNETRSNDRGKIMRAVAARMTEAEMKAVAEYLAGM